MQHDTVDAAGRIDRKTSLQNKLPVFSTVEIFAPDHSDSYTTSLQTTTSASNHNHIWIY